MVGGAPDGADNAFKWLRVFYAMGRLKPGVRVEDATGELSGVIGPRTAREGRSGRRASSCSRSRCTCRDRPGRCCGPCWRARILMLLIACANVAGLRVSRAAQHQRALAIRAALGASPRRLAAQVLCESVLLTLAALGAAVAVAWGTLTVLLALAPGNVPRLDDVALLDGRVLAFGALGAFVTATLCALWPVLVARRVARRGRARARRQRRLGFRAAAACSGPSSSRRWRSRSRCSSARRSSSGPCAASTAPCSASIRNDSRRSRSGADR